MPSLPLTAQEEQKILKELSLSSVEDLFVSIPPAIRERARFSLDFGWTEGSADRGLTEHELRLYFSRLASSNSHSPEYTHFLGGGVYDNVIPAIVNQLVLRGEFLTSYTPYQPEISQGTLQVIFEFQTMMARISGMGVANASMYDGATSIAEAALMAERISGGKGKLLISGSCPPDVKEVVDTFLKLHSSKPTRIPESHRGTIDLVRFKELCMAENPIGVIIPYPSYFGLLEPLDEIKSLLPKGCLLIAAVPDISALSLFEAPGRLGADIVAGEAHQLGTPMLFGGPHVGFFATKKEFLRQMPGRLCGQTKDSEGRTAYTLTLSTREQHIRREKATSNICTNQGLIALRTAIYLSFLGKEGFRKLGEMNYSLFSYLTAELERHGIPRRFQNDLFYREGVFEVPNLPSRFQRALARKIIPGIRLEKEWGVDYQDAILISVNPKHTRQDIDALVEVMSHD